MEISLKINGKEINANVKPNTLLSTFIRENLNLTGTHIGCDTSQCGACAIHLNGDAVKSCAYKEMNVQYVAADSAWRTNRCLSSALCRPSGWSSS